MKPTRAVLALSTVAALLVSWFMARMWLGERPEIWNASVVLGAWAPLISAVVFAYVRSVNDREHSVVAAWLVRAIGMHCVLLWMLGVGDALAGAPGGVRSLNPDAAAPLVLLSFFPAFALSFGLVEWLRRVLAVVQIGFLRPTLPGDRGETQVFRGVAVIRERQLLERSPWAGYLVSAGLTTVAVAAPSVATRLLPFAASMLGLLCVRNPRAVPVSLAALGLGGALVSPAMTHSTLSALAAAPWVGAGALLCYLLTMELISRASELRAPVAAR
ncbi:MAG: hypothetical protein Q8Q09_23055 [Deltaproteobacteria bacterium]|nr:hypothetical protein [Deltaproteobacteria bacterium]